MVLTLVVCAAVRLGFHVTAGYMERIPSSCMNPRYMYLEHALVREAQTPPRILLMGNSLTRYGLREGQIAAAAGLNASEVVNVGIENGSIWDALVLLRRNPELARTVQLIVYALQPGQLNPGSRARWIGYFYPFSTLTEKLHADRWSDRACLVLDWVWPYHSQRRDLTTWLTGLTGESTWQDSDDLRPAWIPENLAKLKARSRRFDGQPNPQAIIGIGTELSAQHIRHLRDFIAYCRQHKIAVVFITTPTRRCYDEVVENTPTLYAGLQRFEDFLVNLDAPYIPFQSGHNRITLGLDDPVDFFDYCHLTPDGARKLTSAVSRALIKHRWLPIGNSPLVLTRDGLR